jgi:hypothetical protein
LHSEAQLREGCANETVGESEFPLAPRAEAAAWADTAEYDHPEHHEREDTLRELLGQLRGRQHPYHLEAMLAPAR